MRQSDFARWIASFLRNKQIDEMRKVIKDPTMFENLTKCDPDMLLAMYDRFDSTFAEYEIETLLPRVKCPVLLLRGDVHLGSLVTEADFKKALTLVPTMSYTQLRDVGHSLFEGDNSAITNLAKTHLAKWSSAASLS